MTAGLSSPVKKGKAGGRGPNALGNLEPVQEETKAHNGNELKNWESQNIDYFKQLNKKEARKKIQGFWKNKPLDQVRRPPTSLMEELNPSSSDT